MIQIYTIYTFTCNYIPQGERRMSIFPFTVLYNKKVRNRCFRCLYGDWVCIVRLEEDSGEFVIKFKHSGINNEPYLDRTLVTLLNLLLLSLDTWKYWYLKLNHCTIVILYQQSSNASNFFSYILCYSNLCFKIFTLCDILCLRMESLEGAKYC
jgi:hypothetical protein